MPRKPASPRRPATALKRPLQPAVPMTLEALLRNPLVGKDAGISLYAIRLIVAALGDQRRLPPSLRSVFLLLAEAANMGSIIAITASMGDTTRNDLSKAFVEARMVLSGEVSHKKRLSILSLERHGATALVILDVAKVKYKEASAARRPIIAAKTAAALRTHVGMRREYGANLSLPRFTVDTVKATRPMLDLTEKTLNAMLRRGRPPRGERSKNNLLHELLCELGIQSMPFNDDAFQKFLDRCRERMAAELPDVSVRS